jgi:hypothetical protein
MFSWIITLQSMKYYIKLKPQELQPSPKPIDRLYLHSKDQPKEHPVDEKLDLGISYETQNLGDVNSNSDRKGESDDLKERSVKDDVA